MSWDDAAATWDTNGAVQAYSRAAFRSLQDVLDARGAALSGARVLDFGCGTGLLTAAMADDASSIVGFDISLAMRAVLDAKGIPNVTTASGDLAALDVTVDLITCSSVCAFVPDYPETIRQLTAKLAPGGLLVQWDWEQNPSDEAPMGLRREDIEAALVSAGLVDVTVGIGFHESFEGHVMAPLCGVGRKAADDHKNQPPV
ncbi:MAG: class I SAM-dependent methyltransferase [Myxococcota bacterium]